MTSPRIAEDTPSRTEAFARAVREAREATLKPMDTVDTAQLSLLKAHADLVKFAED